MSSVPNVTVPPMCSRHMRMVARIHGRGAGVLAFGKFGMALFTRAVEDPEVMRKAGYEPGLPGAMAKAEKLTEIFAEMGALCCWAGDSVVEQYALASTAIEGPGQ